MIHYHCRHCELTMGQLPLTVASQVLPIITQLEYASAGEHYSSYQADGTLVVYAICEQCEQTLQQFPHYYALEKWLQ